MSIESLQVRKRGGLPALALGLGIVALLSSTFGMVSGWPPVFQTPWLVTDALAIATLVAGLIASRRAVRSGARIAAAAAILAGLLAFSVPVRFYQATYHDYPFDVLLPVALGTPIACWFCRLRTLALALVAGLIVWFYGALVPPRPGTRRTLRSGDLTLTISPPLEGTDGWTVQIQGVPGEDLSRRYDLDHVEVQGGIGPWIPVDCWPPYRIDSSEESDASSFRESMIFKAFVPFWTRSWDARVVVPTWPTLSQVHVTATAPQNGNTVKRKAMDGTSLEVSGLRWTDESISRIPAVPCLVMTVRYGGGDHSGYGPEDLRLMDESGRIVPYDALSSTDSTVEIEAFPASRATNRVRVDLYSPDVRASDRLSLDFSGLPPR